MAIFMIDLDTLIELNPANSNTPPWPERTTIQRSSKIEDTSGLKDCFIKGPPCRKGDQFRHHLILGGSTDVWGFPKSNTSEGRTGIPEHSVRVC